MEEGPTNSTIAQTTPVVRNGTGGRGPVRPDIYDLQESPVRGQKRTYEETVVEEETYTNRESELHFNRLQEDSLLPPVEDESLQFVQGADDESIEANMEDSLPVQETTPPPAKKTRRGKVGRNSTDQASAKVSAPKADRRGGVRPGSGRKPKPVLPNKRAARLSIAEETSPEPQPKNHAPVQHVTKTKRKVLEPEPEEVELDSSDEVELPVEESVVEPEPEPMPPPRKPGRPKAVNVHRDPASAAKDEPAFKVPALPQKRGPKPKATPSERDPNVTAGSVAAFRQERSASKAASEAPTNASTMSRRPPIARGLQYLRQGTPMEDAGMRTTRSGRSSIKPVEWWKGEGVKYDYTGGNVEVVRAEEREVAKPKRGRQKQKRKVKAEESDDDEELADWEADPGILQGSVYIWDPELGIATNEVEDQGQ
jgi:centromere protein C